MLSKTDHSQISGILYSRAIDEARRVADAIEAGDYDSAEDIAGDVKTAKHYERLWCEYEREAMKREPAAAIADFVSEWPSIVAKYG